MYLGFREREINGIKQIVERIPIETNIALTDYEAANDIKYVFERDMVTIVDFSIISPISVTLKFLDTGELVDDSTYWYNDQDQMKDISKILNSFKDFALANVDLTDRGYLFKMSEYTPDSIYTVGE